MIILTRLGGHALAVNPDLIERAEVTPDTVITMTDGHKFVVAEALDQVVDRIRSWRAGIAAEAYLTVADADRLSAGRHGSRPDGDSDGGTDSARRLERLALVTGLSTTVLPNLPKEG